MNEKVDVVIAGRRLQVEVEGLLPMEIASIATIVNEKLTEVQGLYPKVVDTSKLAIYTAFCLAVELYKLQQAEKTNHNALENTLDHISKALQQSLAAAGAAPEAE